MNATALPLTSATLASGVALLSHLGVIRISGEDAARFIHGQLTQDFSLLGQDQARLAAFCSAKGRMQASFIGFKRPDGDILLVCSKDLLAATLKRLSMFVLRAKARLTDASADFALYGLAGGATKTIADRAHSAWAKADFDAQSVIDLYPADGVVRQLCVVPLAEPAPAGAALSLDIWRWGEVRSGVATLTAPVIDAFVPQMLNYESVGGVNFKKGCYPGQEVVARSQFRGTLKRRIFLVHGTAAMAVGDEVFSSSDADQPAGLVVQCAAAPQGGFDALVSVQLTATEGSTLHHQSAGGALLQRLPLPYPLLADV
ncbi:MAG: folate-binding protein YgfZ [Burkholderiales bacterium]|nr:folate-binding protein YgfZ [Burkholderiales bacterium]